MKLRRFLLHSMSSAFLFFISYTAAALDFNCPSIDELKQFDGLLYIEYPINIDVQTQKPASWLVAKTDMKVKDVVDTFVISPVIPQDDEYPADAALRMVDALQTYPTYRSCDDKMQLCACFYWNSYDGSFASYIHSENKEQNRRNPLNGITAANTLWKRVHH